MSDWQIIAWWELRRIPFNLIVGVSGIATCLIVVAVDIVSEALLGRDTLLPDKPLFAVVWVVLYGVIANVCYTGGWATELIVKRTWPEEAASFPTLSFSVGLAFSVLLTLSVGVVLGIAGSLSLIVCLFRGTAN